MCSCGPCARPPNLASARAGRLSLRSTPDIASSLTCQGADQCAHHSWIDGEVVGAAAKAQDQVFPVAERALGSDLLVIPSGRREVMPRRTRGAGRDHSATARECSWRSPRRGALSRLLAANASDGPESGTAAGGRACPPSAGCQHDEQQPVHDRPIKSRRTSLTGDGRHTSEQQQQVRRPSPDEPWTSQDHFRSGPSVFAKRGSRAAVNDHGGPPAAPPRTRRSRSAHPSRP